MAILHSKYTQGPLRVPASQWAGDVVCARYDYAYDPTSGDGDIVELGILPAHHSVRDAVVISEDVDGGSDFETDVGLMNGKVGDDVGPDGSTPRTCGAEFFSGATVGRGAGTQMARMTLPGGFLVEPTDEDRSIGVKLVDQGTVAGTYTLIVWYST